MADVDARSDPDAPARYVLAVRRMIKAAIAEDIVHNPAIDMLFTLSLARPDGAWLAVGDVCAEVRLSGDGCRRWGALLVERGLVVVDADRYRLSDEGRALMDRVNGAVRSLADEHFGRVADAD